MLNSLLTRAHQIKSANNGHIGRAASNATEHTLDAERPIVSPATRPKTKLIPVSELRKRSKAPPDKKQKKKPDIKLRLRTDVPAERSETKAPHRMRKGLIGSATKLSGPAFHEKLDAECRKVTDVPRLLQLLRTYDRDRGPYVRRLIRGICKSGDQALVLSQILYWFDHEQGETHPRYQKRISDKAGLPKSHQQLSDETGVPVRQVKETIRQLTKLGYIYKPERHFSFGKCISHMQVNVERITKEIAEALASAQRR